MKDFFKRMFKHILASEFILALIKAVVTDNEVVVFFFRQKWKITKYMLSLLLKRVWPRVTQNAQKFYFHDIISR